ncbi:MAG: hypothetical protein RLY97_805 [Pseudomonadota bacterium]
MHGMKHKMGRHGAAKGRFGGHGEGRGDGRGMFGGPRGGDGLGRGMAGGMGGRGRGGKRFTSEDIQLLLLSLLHEKPSHGYELIKAIDGLSGGAYAPSPGVVYPLLAMLVEMGHLDETSKANGRKTFEITAAGIAQIENETNAARIVAIKAQLADLAGEASRSDVGPVRRAMMNLRNATMQRLGKGDGGDQLGFDVAAILDEAAQKIERLA